MGKAWDSCFQLLPSFGASRLKDSLKAALGTDRFSVNVFVSNWSENVVEKRLLISQLIKRNCDRENSTSFIK